MMKHTILILIALIYCFGCFAQGQYMKLKNSGRGNAEWQPDSTVDLKPKVEKLFKDAPFIFKGEVIASKTYRKGYTAYKIKINKIFRGNLKSGTVEIIENELICHKLDYDGSIILLPADDHIYLSYSGIYFCKLSMYPDSGEVDCIWTPEKGYKADITDFTQADNTVHLTEINTLSGMLQLSYGEMIKFKSKEEIYQFIEKYGNVTIPRDTGKTEEPPQPKQTPAQKQEADSIKQAQNKLLYEQRKKNYAEYEKQIEQRIKIKEAQQKKEEKK